MYTEYMLYFLKEKKKKKVSLLVWLSDLPGTTAVFKARAIRGVRKCASAASTARLKALTDASLALELVCTYAIETSRISAPSSNSP